MSKADKGGIMVREGIEGHILFYINDFVGVGSQGNVAYRYIH